MNRIITLDTILFELNEMTGQDREEEHFRADGLLLKAMEVLSRNKEENELVASIAARYKELEKWYT